MAEIVTYETRGPVAIITLRRPEARNAINGAMADALDAAMDELERDDDVVVGILAADTADQERPVFCAGADLKEIATRRSGPTPLPARRPEFAFRPRQKPVIAAVDGLATAGGCELVLGADLVVASTRSAFGLAEVKRNLVAAGGGLFRLPRALGQRVAMEAILTGEPVPAARAYELGFVNRLTPPGEALTEALALGKAISRNAPLAVQASRAIVLATDRTDEELRAMGEAAISRLRSTEDGAEGLAAFAEKRPPRWRGR